MDDSAALLEPFLLPARIERLREAARQRTRNLRVVLDGVHDPHNLSAAVRSCDGFGVLELHVIESAKPFRVRRKVSQGTEKWIRIRRHPDPADAVAALRGEGFDLWVADPRPGGRAVDELPWEKKLALVFGNEKSGASREVSSAAAGFFCIPMYGFGDSFNVSVAAGIALAVAVRERLRRLGHHGDLSPAEQEALIAEWMKRAVKNADRILAHLAARGSDDHAESDDAGDD